MTKGKTYTASEKSEAESTVGRVGSITQGGIEVSVKVVEERFRFGRRDLCVAPLAGDGSKWVEFHNVKLSEDVAWKKYVPNVVIDEA